MFGDRVAVATRESCVDQSTSPDLGLQFSSYNEHSKQDDAQLENLHAPNFDPLYRLSRSEDATQQRMEEDNKCLLPEAPQVPPMPLPPTFSLSSTRKEEVDNELEGLEEDPPATFSEDATNPLPEPKQPTTSKSGPETSGNEDASIFRK